MNIKKVSELQNTMRTRTLALFIPISHVARRRRGQPTSRINGIDLRAKRAARCVSHSPGIAWKPIVLFITFDFLFPNKWQESNCEKGFQVRQLKAIGASHFCLDHYEWNDGDRLVHSQNYLSQLPRNPRGWTALCSLDCQLSQGRMQNRP